jgi:hypothetical protein
MPNKFTVRFETMSLEVPDAQEPLLFGAVRESPGLENTMQ